MNSFKDFITFFHNPRNFLDITKTIYVFNGITMAVNSFGGFFSKQSLCTGARNFVCSCQAILRNKLFFIHLIDITSVNFRKPSTNSSILADSRNTICPIFACQFCKLSNFKYLSSERRKNSIHTSRFHFHRETNSFF